jgi:hypothetical protein
MVLGYAPIKHRRQEDVLPMLEAPVEAHLVARVRHMGGISLKTDRVDGKKFLDRTCFLPHGRVAVFELKRPKGGRLDKYQTELIKQLIALGIEVYRCNTKEEVDAALKG